MFLLTNKALIWVGKEQKEKPIIITMWAVWRVSIPFRLEIMPGKQEMDVGLRLDGSPTVIRV